MRTLVITLGGAPTKGDVVILGYSAKRGGRTETGYIVKDGDKLSDIATQLAFGINTHFCQPLFSAKAKDDVVCMICQDGADDAQFHSVVEHIVGANHLEREPGGSETVTIAE